MNSVNTIALSQLAFLLFPAALVLLIMVRWQQKWQKGLVAIGRMLLQLIAIGYALSWIFAINKPGVMFALLLLMMAIAAWISLNTVTDQRKKWFKYSLFSVTSVSLAMLSIVILLVLEVKPWYQAHTVIPIDGMIFANTMTSISLAAERYQSSRDKGASTRDSRNQAFSSAMIPIVNSLLAVGLVSLPGMMTGQILSGVSPLIAARYQIMVMLMLFASSGLASSLFLYLVCRKGK